MKKIGEAYSFTDSVDINVKDRMLLDMFIACIEDRAKIAISDGDFETASGTVKLWEQMKKAISEMEQKDEKRTERQFSTL